MERMKATSSRTSGLPCTFYARHRALENRGNKGPTGAEKKKRGGEIGLR